jgi:hypothetical protein
LALIDAFRFYQFKELTQGQLDSQLLQNIIKQLNERSKDFEHRFQFLEGKNMLNCGMLKNLVL